MNDGFFTYEHFHFEIKTSIKLLGFYLFIYSIFMTLLSNHFYPGFYLFIFFFAQIIV